jgi:hypothetical protein
LAVIAWPAAVAFNFNSKVWGHVLVNGVSEIAYTDALWERLVLPERTKELLLATTASGLHASALVSGKAGKSAAAADAPALSSNGNLFLLYGPPGVGKTATVEALAEKFQRPLYSLSFGELGTSVRELEQVFSSVLALCSEWGALVLLDEGDALVERREKGQLLLNSLVGVLLRTLDKFEGQLFLTTNRIRVSACVSLLCANESCVVADV